jgi:hypothetical protein
MLKRIRHQKFAALLLILAVLLQPTTPARADVAPPEPPRGANPYPTAATNVRMMAETVLIEVRDYSGGEAARAYITADFTMRNLGETAETLEVRFPLYDTGFSFESIYECQYRYYGGYPYINDLVVWVNGQWTPTQIIYETFNDWRPYEDGDEVTLGCWAHFQAAFPPGQDVMIKVTYSTQPFFEWTANLNEYSYVLITGAGWQGTIGSAEIIFRAPYELSDYNFFGCGMEWPYTDCSVAGHEARWQAADFEPEDNFSALALAPADWYQILIERENTALHPEDGEAWGRLGKAYKNAIIQKHGYRDTPAGLEMYQWSQEAYQKAVALLPNDADWHYGYADLVCEYAIWKLDTPEAYAAGQVCLAEIQRALEINPAHEQAQKLKRTMAYWGLTGPDGLNTSTPGRPTLTNVPTWPPPIVTTPRLPSATPTLPPSAIAAAVTLTSPTPGAPAAQKPVTQAPDKPALPSPSPGPAPAEQPRSMSLLVLTGIVILLVAAGLGVVISRLGKR